MRIAIIGAGEVGTTIARNLSEDHDVILIDNDSELINRLKYEIDVLTLDGDGTSLDVLESADVGSCGMVLACTDDDMTNLVVCGTAKALGDPFTVARTKSTKYLRTWERDNSAFDVDSLVCTDLLAAQDIVRVSGLPSAVDVDFFAGGCVQMAEFELDEESSIANQTIADADRFESLTFVSIFRDGDILFPRGDTVLRPDDRTVVIGSPESVQTFAKEIAPRETPGQADEIVIVGGGEIGYQTARLLENRGLSPQLIENDPARARWLAEQLPNTFVMAHDATDTQFLLREHVDEADIVVAALGSDEKNLLVSMLAKRLGCSRIVSVVDSGEYVTLFEEIGVDVAINPRQVTAEDIIRFTFETVAENVAVLENDQGEVVEIELDSNSALVGARIDELTRSLDGNFVIGAVTRNGELVTPRGDTVLQENDHLIAFVETESVSVFLSNV